MALQIPADVVELLVQGLLRPDPDIQDVVGTRVYSTVPPKPTYPLVRIERVGGQLATSRFLWLDRARVDVNIWGDTHKATWRAANTVRSLLIAAQCTTYEPLGRVDGITELSWRDPVREQEAGRYRAIGEYEVLVRPLEVTTGAAS